MSSDLWARTVVDWTVLSEGLFELAKAQSRVYHIRDDDLIKSKVQDAAALVERMANINLAAATYEASGADIQPALDSACCWCQQFRAYGYLLPFNNVRAVRLFDDADVDITGDWSVRQREFGSNRDAYLLHPTPAALVAARLEADIGVDDVDDLDPAVRSLVLRLAAALYENRESNVPLMDTDFATARFYNELTAIWRPTA